MIQWELSPFMVTPAAGVLSRCVSRGALTQEEIDSASFNLSPAFSSQLHEAEQRIRMQRQLDQLQLEAELLKTEQNSADITNTFHLARKFHLLQVFCSHLENVLKEQNALKQRLIRPLGTTNLPVHAHLHRFVVDSVSMLLDFVGSLEENLTSVRSGPSTRNGLDQLNASLAQLLPLVSELDSLSNQVLHWKPVHSRNSVLSDSSA